MSKVQQIIHDSIIASCCGIVLAVSFVVYHNTDTVSDWQDEVERKTYTKEEAQVFNDEMRTEVNELKAKALERAAIEDDRVEVFCNTVLELRGRELYDE